MKPAAVLTLAAWASTARAAAVSKPKPTLDVHIDRVSNTRVQVSITNEGSSEVELLNKGTLLDDDPTEKLLISQEGSRIPFRGMRKKISTANLSTIVTPVKANETIEMVVDAASLHHLAGGGRFDVVAEGAIPYAWPGSDTFDGAARYRSNRLDLDVDGAEAARVPEPFSLQKRAKLQADCVDFAGDSTRFALNGCRDWAFKAAAAVQTDNARLLEYFGDDSMDTMRVVEDRFNAIGDECSSDTEGLTSYFCTDDDHLPCGEGTLAYAMVGQNVIVNCDGYYQLPQMTTECHVDDQVGTTLHEMTHADAVYSPTTTDYAYGYEACIDLDASAKIMNADNWLLYANAVWLDC